MQLCKLERGMAVNIHNLIAAIRPDLYCDKSDRELIKKVKEVAAKEGYLKAAEIAKPRETEPMDLVEIQFKSPAEKHGLKSPAQKNVLIYDSTSEGLEPTYFWIIDKMSEEYKKTEKLIDNFVSSPGSGHFSEMNMKATKMQEEGMKLLGSANQVIKSILSLIYDLKEFKIRLALYNDYHSEDKTKKNSALLSLKQIWMDTVDVKRGPTALKGLIQQFDYVTVIDAFMSAESLEHVTKSEREGGLDLNDRVRRIIQQRVGEFFRWIDESERELRKRYQIERTYLKSQVSTVKLYARWAKPYLRAAQKLEQNANPESWSGSFAAGLVSAFNTSILELVLMGTAPYSPDADIAQGDLPKIAGDKKLRKYASLVLVEFHFRSIPERTNQGGYGFRGRIEIIFSGYGLNEDEIKIFKSALLKDDLKDVLQLVEGATGESLEVMMKDIDEFMKEDEKKESKEEKKSGDVNPFSELLSIFKPNKEESKEEKKEEKSEKKEEFNDKKIIPKDSQVEELLRSQAIIGARRRAYRLYDLYKKSKGLFTVPDLV